MNWKKILYSILCVLLLIGTVEFCKKKTDGFTVLKVQDNFDLTPYSASSPALSPEISHILNQPFSYLGRGKQSFVFASEDGQYVVKLFNNRYQKKLTLFSLLSHIPFVSSWAGQKAAYNTRKLHLTFTSYHIARDKLSEETALLYLHDTPLNTPLQLHIVDKLGISHTLSLKTTSFALQRRADPFYPTLLKLRSKGEVKKAQVLLHSLFELLITRCSKEIFDNDPLLRTNFGFIDGRAVEIDIGPFSIDPKVKDPAVYRKEIYRITTSLKVFLEEKFPELLPELEKQYKEKLQL